MPLDFNLLEGKPRILITAALKPVLSARFQPTGFPDLGPATYDRPPDTEDEKRDYPKGVPTLLVESAQSMANRLEAVCWDNATEDLVASLQGLPYIKVTLVGLGDGSDTTSSILEFHRLNSPYIMQKPKDSTRSLAADGKWFREVIRAELGLSNRAEETEPSEDDEPSEVEGVVNLRRLARICFKYDPNSLIHGVFLEKIAGRLRHPRALSAFIEASGVKRVDSGGVKFDQVLPKPSVKGLNAKEGFGHVPFHRTEFTADSITAFFSIDLAQIRGYGLNESGTRLLIALSLWKIRSFLDSPIRLRTACELELRNGIDVRQPDKFEFPLATELQSVVQCLITQCNEAGLFIVPPKTSLTWNMVEKKEAEKVEIELPSDFPAPGPFDEAIKDKIDYKKGTKRKPSKLILKKGLSEEIIAEIQKTKPDDKELLAILKSKMESISQKPKT